MDQRVVFLYEHCSGAAEGMNRLSVVGDLSLLRNNRLVCRVDATKIEEAPGSKFVVVEIGSKRP